MLGLTPGGYQPAMATHKHGRLTFDALQEKVHLGLNQLCGFLAAKLGGSNPWGYPNSWMVYKGKSIYHWMILGVALFQETLIS